MSAKPVHLLVMVHGMWGNPNHLSEMERIIQERCGSDSGLRTLVAKSNQESSTYDGIDWGGERVAEEVRCLVCQLRGILKATSA